MNYQKNLKLIFINIPCLGNKIKMDFTSIATIDVNNLQKMGRYT